MSYTLEMRNEKCGGEGGHILIYMHRTLLRHCRSEDLTLSRRYIDAHVGRGRIHELGDGAGA
jgi:hypothetical protein